MTERWSRGRVSRLSAAAIVWLSALPPPLFCTVFGQCRQLSRKENRFSSPGSRKRSMVHGEEQWVRARAARRREAGRGAFCTTKSGSARGRLWNMAAAVAFHYPLAQARRRRKGAARSQNEGPQRPHPRRAATTSRKDASGDALVQDSALWATARRTSRAAGRKAAPLDVAEFFPDVGSGRQPKGEHTADDDCRCANWEAGSNEGGRGGSTGEMATKAAPGHGASAADAKRMSCSFPESCPTSGRTRPPPPVP